MLYKDRILLISLSFVTQEIFGVEWAIAVVGGATFSEDILEICS